MYLNTYMRKWFNSMIKKNPIHLKANLAFNLPLATTDLFPNKFQSFIKLCLMISANGHNPPSKMKALCNATLVQMALLGCTKYLSPKGTGKTDCF